MITTNPRARNRRRVASVMLPVLVASLTAVALTTQAATATQPVGNLSEALNMSLYFYDAEESGPSRSLGQQPLSWRGDSEPSDAEVPLIYDLEKGTNLPESFISQNRSILDPDGDGTVDLSGGFHDAGDHVKFGLPQSYSAATLGWGLYEFKDAFVEAGAYDHMMEELRWFSDYLLRSTFRNASGDVVAFNYMVGRGGVDHTYWGPPELQDPLKYPRPATFAFAGEPASDQAAGASAALTIMSLNTETSDPSYAAECLDVAKALYRFAVANRGTGNGDGFYPSSYDDDEMAWAAVWLYIATGTESYLDDIIGTDANGRYTGYLKKIIAGPQDTWQNIWVHSWDTVWGGVFAKLAPATEGVIPQDENDKYWYYFQWNLEYWTGGEVAHDNPSDTNFISTSPGGFSVVTTWGSARYNTAAQLCALVFRKYAGDTEKSIGLTDWALSQMNYIMGDNPNNKSYIVGFGEVHVEHPHHRAAHGSSTNSMLDPPEHRHTLWGALAGGPDDADFHKDVTTDFVYNEVAIDYNAGFVGALAGLFHYYGQNQPVIKWAPPSEKPELNIYSTARMEQESNQRSQVTMQINNYATDPPRFEDQLSVRYYFDISEMMEYGQTIDALNWAIYYDESKSFGYPATVTGPHAWDAANGIYYMELAWTDAPIYGKRDIQLALWPDQDSSWQTHWDPSNDWSREGLTASYEITPNIPTYNAGVLVAGIEPGGTQPTTTTTRPTTTTTRPTTTTTRPTTTTTRPTTTTTRPTTTTTTRPTTTTTTRPTTTTTRPTTTTTRPTTTTTTTRPTTTTTQNTAGLSCSVRMDQWNSGYVAYVTVTNVGSSAISGWSVNVSMSAAPSIFNYWNATISTSGNVVSASNVSWNGYLGVGQSASFGFQGSGNGNLTAVCE